MDDPVAVAFWVTCLNLVHRTNCSAVQVQALHSRKAFFSVLHLCTVSPQEAADWCIHFSCIADLFFCCNPLPALHTYQAHSPAPIHSPSILGEKSQKAHFTIHFACWAAKPAQHYEQQVPSLLIIYYPSFMTLILLLSLKFPKRALHLIIWPHLYISKQSAPAFLLPMCLTLFPVLSASLSVTLFPHWEVCSFYILLICVSTGICLPTLMGFALL